MMNYQQQFYFRRDSVIGYESLLLRNNLYPSRPFAGTVTLYGKGRMWAVLVFVLLLFFLLTVPSKDTMNLIISKMYNRFYGAKDKTLSLDRISGR